MRRGVAAVKNVKDAERQIEVATRFALRADAVKYVKDAERAVKNVTRLALRGQGNARQQLLAHLMRAEVGAHGRLSNGDYRKSVERLRRATQSLNTINDPSKARKLADEIERALLDVRRELWKLEQAEKQNAKDPIKRKDKQSDSAVVFVEVPVLAVPIRLDLQWPILSGATNSKDKLFFIFRRF